MNFCSFWVEELKGLVKLILLVSLGFCELLRCYLKRVSRIHHQAIIDGLVVYPANAFDSRLRGWSGGVSG